jgi:hypothetical protein
VYQGLTFTDAIPAESSGAFSLTKEAEGAPGGGDRGDQASAKQAVQSTPPSSSSGGISAGTAVSVPFLVASLIGLIALARSQAKRGGKLAWTPVGARGSAAGTSKASANHKRDDDVSGGGSRAGGVRNRARSRSASAGRALGECDFGAASSETAKRYRQMLSTRVRPSNVLDQFVDLLLARLGLWRVGSRSGGGREDRELRELDLEEAAPMMDDGSVKDVHAQWPQSPRPPGSSHLTGVPAGASAFTSPLHSNPHNTQDSHGVYR